MYKLGDPISAIPGVGPKYKKLLEKLEIYTIGDILYHFPFRYDDYSQKKAIKDVEEGDIVTIEGIIGDFKNIHTKNSKKLSKATIADYTGELPIIWFNQHYLSKVVTKGGWYKISGRVGIFSNKLTMISPEIEKGKKENLNTGRLVPVYPEKAGISSKWLRSRIYSLLKLDLALPEILPNATRDKYDLKEIRWSLEQIHFPDNEISNNLARKRLSFEELLIELLRVEHRKIEWSKNLTGHFYKPFSDEIDEFIINLPFRLTKSQKEATHEILLDMQKKHPMNRILEGDVGTGKTIAAIIAAYLTYKNKVKILCMAPTELLARQHYKTFKEFLGSYGITVALTTGSTKKLEENWDILIGTHTLIYKREYENIGLIIIDEQHRFGVEQRGMLLKLIKGTKVPHLLTMTATPIPRTLALTLYGDLSISVLKEHPNKERNVVTKVISQRQRLETYEWIKRRGESAFIVCPLIEESESASLENVKAAEAEYKNLKESVFSDIKIGLLHGRMKSKEKDEVVKQFSEGKIQVLVSTPVIEVGIDIPEATIMIIESAERYGLASLHQLRGRVGRGDKDGFCFLFLSSNSKKAYFRLKNLENITNGLELAEIDMKIRGQGDIFGTMQHGFRKFKIARLDDLQMLEKVKIEAQNLYCELDKHKELKNEIENRANTQIRPN
ncbi:ATP-dependent DNA helicase RecG [Patescibacteria group bacterium]|nr:ATP-dependent DNA helicase RecG [Patescibacteria group bacterium]